MIGELLLRFLRDERGFLPFVGGLLATAAKTAVGGLVAGAISRRNRKKEYEQERELGFTHSEIAGSGGLSDGGMTVLGNQYNQFLAQRQQMEYDAEQRELDRQVAMRGQDAGVQAAQTSASASMYGSNIQAQIAEGQLALQRDQFNQVQLPQALNDIATSTPEWKRQQLLATMGVDNMIATVIAGARGIDIMDPQTLQGMSRSEFQNLVREIYGLQSTVFREGSGLMQGVSQLGTGVRDAMDAHASHGPVTLGSGTPGTLTRSPLEGMAR